MGWQRARAVSLGPSPGLRPGGSGAKMGGGGSTRRVTFEADENENITVVKGVRVRAGLPGHRGPVRGHCDPAWLGPARPFSHHCSLEVAPLPPPRPVNEGFCRLGGSGERLCFPSG